MGKSRIILFSFVISAFSLAGLSQEYLTEFSGQIKTTGRQYLVPPVVDTSGNIFLCGSFEGQLQFGNQNLISRGEGDLFVAFLQPSGTIKRLWKFAGKRYPGLVGTYYDGKKQLTILGYFNDSLTGQGVRMFHPGSNHLFFMQFDLSGNLIKSGILLPHFKGRVKTFILDDSGNYILTGSFRSRMKTGSAELIPKGKEDVFIVKISPEGTVLKALSIGGTGRDLAQGLLWTPENHLLYGDFERRFRAGDTSLLSKGRSDAFILRFDSTFSIKEAVAYGGPGDDHMVSVMTGTRNNYFATGSFKKHFLVGDKELISKGLSDIFLMELDSSLNITTGKIWGGPSNDVPASLLVDSKNRIFLSGKFKKSIYFGSDSLQTTDRFSDGFLLMLDDSMVVNWWKHFSGRSEENPLFQVSLNPDRVFFGTSFFTELITPGETCSSAGTGGLYWSVFLDPCSLLKFNLSAEKYICAGSTDTLDAGAGYISYLWKGGLSEDRYLTVSDTGLYPVQITDSYGCRASDTVKVLIDSVHLEYEVQDEILPEANNGSIELKVQSGFPPWEIYWDHGPRENTLTGLSSGFYRVTVTDSLNCSTSAEIFVDQSSASGILDIFNFPNPVNDLTRIIYSLPEDTGLEISLYDFSGRKVAVLYSGTNQKGKYGFDWSRKNISNGVYYLRITTPEGTLSKKMIVGQK